MRNISFKNWFQRSALIVVALLISNVAALTCALAMDICSDCPEEPPSHCIDMFDDSGTVSVDKSSKEISATYPDGNPFYTTELLSKSHKISAEISAKQWPPNAVYSPPPINVLNCVFLK
jgi:hypothetical protein